CQGAPRAISKGASQGSGLGGGRRGIGRARATTARALPALGAGGLSTGLRRAVAVAARAPAAGLRGRAVLQEVRRRALLPLLHHALRAECLGERPGKLLCLEPESVADLLRTEAIGAAAEQVADLVHEGRD